MSCDLNKGQVQKKTTNKILPYDRSIERYMILLYTLYSEKDRRLYAAAEAFIGVPAMCFLSEKNDLSHRKAYSPHLPKDILRRISVCTGLDLGRLNHLYNQVRPANPNERVIAIKSDATSLTAATMIMSCEAGWCVVPLSNQWPKAFEKKIIQSIGVCKIQHDDGSVQNIELESPPNRQDLPMGFVFTSGSTGTPKPVEISCKAMSRRLQWYLKTFTFGFHEDQTVFKSPPTFIDSWLEVLSSWYSGGHLVYIPAEKRIDGAAFVQAIIESNCRRIICSPPHGRELFLRKESVLSSALRLIILTGDDAGYALPYDLLSIAPDMRVINLYGASELSGDAMWYEFDRQAPHDSTLGTPIGKPLPGCQAAIINANKEGMGHLQIQGWCVAKYLGESKPLSYDTGDLVRQGKNGIYYYIGRSSRIMKRSGIRIDTEAIVSNALENPKVKQACVVQPVKDSAPVLVVDGTDVEEAPIMERLKKHLPSPMIPASIFIMDRIPQTSSGKYDRLSIEQMLRDQQRATVSHSLPQWFVEAWTQGCSGSEPFKADLALDMAGGTSLDAAHIASNINTAIHKLPQYQRRNLDEVDPRTIILCQTPNKVFASMSGKNMSPKTAPRAEDTTVSGSYGKHKILINLQTCTPSFVLQCLQKMSALPYFWAESLANRFQLSVAVENDHIVANKPWTEDVLKHIKNLEKAFTLGDASFILAQAPRRKIKDFRLPTISPNTSTPARQSCQQVGHIVYVENIPHAVALDPSVEGLSLEELGLTDSPASRQWRKPIINSNQTIHFANQRKVEVALIYIWLCAEALNHAHNTQGDQLSYCIDLIEEATVIGYQQGCQAMGFGGMTSVITRDCTLMNKRKQKVPYTSGNAATAVLALEQAQRSLLNAGIPIHKARVAIVGAKGNIGQAVARQLVGRVYRLTLIGREEKDQKLQSLATELGHQVEVGTLKRENIEGCHVIITATNSPVAIIKEDHIPESLQSIIDVATPADTDPACMYKVPGLTVFHGGSGYLPAGNDHWQEPGTDLPRRYIYGCTLEAALTGMSPQSGGTVGMITQQRIAEIFKLLSNTGVQCRSPLSLSPFRSIAKLWEKRFIQTPAEANSLSHQITCLFSDSEARREPTETSVIHRFDTYSSPIYKKALVAACGAMAINENAVHERCAKNFGAYEDKVTEVLCQWVGYIKGKGCAVASGTMGIIQMLLASLSKLREEKRMVIVGPAHHYNSKRLPKLMGWFVNETASWKTSYLHSALMQAKDCGCKGAVIIVTHGDPARQQVEKVQSALSAKEEFFAHSDLNESSWPIHIHCDAVFRWWFVALTHYSIEQNPLGFRESTLEEILHIKNETLDMQLANSIGVDFHKSGFTPYASSYLLSKSPSQGKLWLDDGPDYLAASADDNGFRGADTVECSRSLFGIVSAHECIDIPIKVRQSIVGGSLENAAFLRSLFAESELIEVDQGARLPLVLLRLFGFYSSIFQKRLSDQGIEVGIFGDQWVRIVMTNGFLSEDDLLLLANKIIKVAKDIHNEQQIIAEVPTWAYS